MIESSKFAFDHLRHDLIANFIEIIFQFVAKDTGVNGFNCRPFTLGPCETGNLLTFRMEIPFLDYS